MDILALLGQSSWRQVLGTAAIAAGVVVAMRRYG
tara:strand:+ start:7228 stop:7329 length:102 start_codon:yes stop_codon:yes gene_type:complete